MTIIERGSCVSPASLAPPEILQTIFLVGLETVSPNPNTVERRVLQATTVSCSQVCQSWRAAARSYSKLWSHVLDFERHTSQRTIELIKLSHPYLFDVGFSTCPIKLSTLETLAQVLFQHSGRVRQWNVVFDNQKSDSKGFDPPTARIFHSLTEEGHSLLSKLSLSRFGHLLLPPVDLRHLTELSVDHISSQNAPTVSQWLNILSKTHSLQFLSLHSAISTADQHHTIHPVPLPHLRLISIDGIDSIPTLSLLHPSPVCGMLLDVDLLHINSFALLSRIISHRFRVASKHLSLENQSVELVIDSEGQLTAGNVHDPTVTLNWNEDGGAERVLSYLDVMDSPALSLQLSQFPSRGPMRLILIALLAITVFPHMNSLRLSLAPEIRRRGDFIHPYETIMEAFYLPIRPIPLTTLVLDEDSAILFLPLLQVCEAGALSPLFPSLRNISFDCVTFQPGCRLFYEVLSYLEWRLEVNYPLENVYFERSKIADGAEYELMDYLRGGVHGVGVHFGAHSQTYEGFPQYCRRT